MTTKEQAAAEKAAAEARRKFFIRPIEQDDRVNNFKIEEENERLTQFLRYGARQNEPTGMSRTYVYVEEGVSRPQPVLGFITLVSSEVQEDDGKDTANQLGETFRFPYPCVKIARLAVDLRYRGRHFGENLVKFAISLVKREISTKVGSRLIALDANPPAIKFYERQGFSLIQADRNLKRDEPVMFIDLSRLD